MTFDESMKVAEHAQLLIDDVLAEAKGRRGIPSVVGVTLDADVEADSPDLAEAVCGFNVYLSAGTLKYLMPLKMPYRELADETSRRAAIKAAFDSMVPSSVDVPGIYDDPRPKMERQARIVELMEKGDVEGALREYNDGQLQPAAVA